MNKDNFIELLMNNTSYDREKCIAINKVLENHFIVGKKGKEKIINDFVNVVGIESNDAENLYEICVSLLGRVAKEKIKHPFRSKD